MDTRETPEGAIEAGLPLTPGGIAEAGKVIEAAYGQARLATNGNPMAMATYLRRMVSEDARLADAVAVSFAATLLPKVRHDAWKHGGRR